MTRSARVSFFGPTRAIALAVALAIALAPAAGAALADEAFYIQLASVKSAERAGQAWKELQARHAELLGDMQLMVRSVDFADRGTFYRMQTGPFPNRATAEDMCQQLRAVKLECLIRER